MPDRPSRRAPATDALLLAVVAVAAVVPRVAAVVIGGGGLFGHLGYDGTVYYAAAAGLAAGKTPYQDFLLLHPPGIVLALWPFAELGQLIGDPSALALGRLTWMSMGAGSAVVAALIFRRYGAGPALIAGLGYAMFVPAIRVEHSTTLEAPGSLCLLGAIWLLTRSSGAGDRLAASALLAGCLVGVMTGLKIWGIAVAAVVVVWCLAVWGYRVAFAVIGGFVATLLAICLPFVASAPQEMWRMVVLDQMGRERNTASVGTRLLEIVGLTGWGGAIQFVALCLVATLLLGASVLAWRIPAGQLGVVLMAASLLLLLSAPPWSPDYGALIGPPAVAIAGGAAAALEGPSVSRPPVGVAAALLAVLVGYLVVAGPGKPFGHRFPGASLAAQLADIPGCVTTDDPTLLVETNLLSRNLARGCPLIVDLGGYSYHLQPGATAHRARSKNRQWQRFAIDYLAGGRASVVVRFEDEAGLSAKTWRTIRSWPIRGQVGRYLIRSPN